MREKIGSELKFVQRGIVRISLNRVSVVNSTEKLDIARCRVKWEISHAIVEPSMCCNFDLSSAFVIPVPKKSCIRNEAEKDTLLRNNLKLRTLAARRTDPCTTFKSAEVT